MSLLSAIAYGVRVAAVNGASIKYTLTGANAQAASKIYDIIKGRAQLVSVLGPPGTGKTSIYCVSFTDSWDQDLGSGRIAAYVAPTNQLVLETFGKQLAKVLAEVYKVNGLVKLDDLREILSSTRLYGSKIVLGSRRAIKAVIDEGLIDCDSLSSMECASKLEEAAKVALYAPPTKNLRIVFTTEWQDLISRLKITYGMTIRSLSERVGRLEIGLFIDEASRSPVYRPFATIARFLAAYAAGDAISLPSYIEKLLKVVDIYGLSVVGDDKQAISLDDLYKYERQLLVLLAVKNALGCEWGAPQCPFLDETKRLPEPSQEPISEGFYHHIDGIRIKAKFNASVRLSLLKAAIPWLNKAASSYSGSKRKIINAIVDAISTDRPIVVINTRRFEGGKAIESQRASIAAFLAHVLEYALQQIGTTLDMAVTGPYSDLVNAAKSTYYKLKMYKGTLIETSHPSTVRVRFSSVHSMLGDEADVHITMLGKEWCISTTPTDDLYTIYCQEPELFNVQMSRHSRLLIVVGNLRMIHNKFASVSKRIRKARGIFGKLVEAVAITAEEMLKKDKSVVIRV